MSSSINAGDLYYASIGFGIRRLGLILKTADEAGARDNARRICAMLEESGTQAELLSISKVNPG